MVRITIGSRGRRPDPGDRGIARSVGQVDVEHEHLGRSSAIRRSVPRCRRPRRRPRSASASSSIRRPARTTRWSSASTIVIVAGPPPAVDPGSSARFQHAPRRSSAARRRSTAPRRARPRRAERHVALDDEPLGLASDGGPSGKRALEPVDDPVVALVELDEGHVVGPLRDRLHLHVRRQRVDVGAQHEQVVGRLHRHEPRPRHEQQLGALEAPIAAPIALSSWITGVESDRADRPSCG